MTHTRTRPAIVALAAAVWATGVGLSAPLAPATPVPTEPTTECSEMAHPPAGQPGSASDNPLTRPGQLGELTQPPLPNGQMPMDCLPIGHG